MSSYRYGINYINNDTGFNVREEINNNFSLVSNELSILASDFESLPTFSLPGRIYVGDVGEPDFNTGFRNFTGQEPLCFYEYNGCVYIDGCFQYFASSDSFGQIIFQLPFFCWPFYPKYYSAGIIYALTGLYQNTPCGIKVDTSGNVTIVSGGMTSSYFLSFSNFNFRLAE